MVDRIDLSGLAGMSSEDKVRIAAKMRQARAELARTDYNQFASFVLRDEMTNAPLQQSWAHLDWKRIRDTHRQALIVAHVEAGKTQQFSVGVVLHELGKNPNLRLAVVSRTQSQASKIVRSVAQYVEQSAELKAVFPELKQGKRSGDKWTETMLTVHRDGVGIKEPSLQAFGVDGAPTGSRIDGFIIDDILDDRNTRTKSLRDQVEQKFWRQFYNRLSKNDPFVYFLGNAWHPDDLYSRLEIQGWPTFRYPVLVDKELRDRGICEFLQNPDGTLGTRALALAESTWPEQWSMERILKTKEMTPPIEFARAYLCISRDEGDARFKREWVEACSEQGRQAGIHTFAADLPTAIRSDPFLDVEAVLEERREQDAPVFNPVSEWLGIASALGVRIYTGVDLSTGKGRDLSCIFTIMVYPDGDRRVLDIQSGRWQADEILNRIIGVHKRFSSVVMVENVAAQDYIIQLLQAKTDVPVYAFTTGRNKADPHFGVESLAGELAAGKWIIPCGENGEMEEEVTAWIEEMLFYQPDAHTGDRLMSMWFAREACRRFDSESRPSGVAMTVLG